MTAQDTVITIAAGGAIAVVAYLWYTAQESQEAPAKTNPILPGGEPIPPGSGGGFYEIPPDTAYPDHPFHGIPLLDQTYDAGWKFAQWFRENRYDAYGNPIRWGGW